MKNKQRTSDGPRDPHNPHADTAPRRRALKRLATGGAVVGVAAAAPSSWTRPVVESVTLPAHAQVSGAEDGDFFPVPVVFRDEGRIPDDGSAVASSGGWLEWLVPSARAGQPRPGPVTCNMCEGCARIRDMQVTLSILALDPEDIDSPTVCYEGTGVIGDSVTLSPASSDPAFSCEVPSISLLALEGEAPDRRLVLDAGLGEFYMDEDPSRTCSCGALDCEDAF